MNGPIRILHAIRSDGFAGVEQFVLRLALAQAADGHDVAVVGGAAERMRPALAGAGVEHVPAARTIEVLRAVRRRAAGIDVVNTHMTAADVGAVFGLAGRRQRPAVVSTRHFAQPRGRLGPVPIDALVGGRIDAEVSISAAVAASVDRPSTVVHTGVDARPLGDGRPRDRTVLIAQRLEPEKHTHVGVRAFAASGLAADGWTLEVAGDGSELGALQALVGELGLDGVVRFSGFRSDLPAVMDRAAILIAPCPVEGLGLTVLEAMAGGLPVIAAEAGGHVELLEGLDERTLFAPDDADDAGRRLRGLADDEPGRADLGAAERAHQQQAFSIRAQADGTEAVYRGVL
ncbi:glycosyltransferase [Agromyces mariniharenae]|uniref:glycosyltransferase n=1 Tax=Agromyces mariniharenae TaxID=2604423 RepID=UPI0016532439|nr:glycosyltransferase [Agromyces mariniharenae]